MHRRKSLPAHPNGMIFAAYDAADVEMLESTYYSVGGGFVVDEHAAGADRIVLDDTPVRFPFTTGAELLDDLRARGAAGQRRDARQRAVLAHRGRRSAPGCCTSGR